MEEDVKKSYYAIIPANVRYDKDITPNAKLLYGEITALCNEKGFCWASNDYFSKLYEVSKVSISKWINSLIKKGYVESQFIYKNNSREIDKRIITLSDKHIKENLKTYLTEVKDPIKEKFNTPIKEKFKDNNTLLNNKLNNTNNIYIDLFNFWNSLEIKVHRDYKHNTEFKKAIELSSEDLLKESMKNYKEILNSDYFFSHVWTLSNFLKKQRDKEQYNFLRFLDGGDIWDNYKIQKNKSKPKNKVYVNDVSKYTDDMLNDL